MIKEINVVSLFDGISCGQVALERAGIIIDNYYACEIDKYAIKVTQKNYPNTIQLGDVTKVDFSQLKDIDLVIGGSPCQDLSSYKAYKGERNGLDGNKSRLFFEFIRALKEIKPKYFLLENVVMKQEWEDIISEELGVKPIMINSNLVSAQDRKRLYWTNIPNLRQPNDKEILLKDICLNGSEVDAKYWYNLPFIYNGEDKKIEATINTEKGFMNNMRAAFNLNAKCGTLLVDGSGGNRQKKIYQDGKIRKLTPLEYERLQTLPDNYTDCISNSQRYNTIGNGWTVDVITHIFKNISYSDKD